MSQRSNNNKLLETVALGKDKIIKKNKLVLGSLHMSKHSIGTRAHLPESL